MGGLSDSQTGADLRTLAVWCTGETVVRDEKDGTGTPMSATSGARPSASDLRAEPRV